jgi:hypothetical protein
MRNTFTTLVRTLATLVLVAAGAHAAEGQIVQEHAAGLRSPAKLLALPDGSLLVAEAGNGPNTGRISLIDRDRRQFTVIDGLPSALFLGRDASGPSGLLLIGDRLYVSIGSGDVTVAGAGQGSEIPNPSPASPLFSSVLLLELPSADIPLGFTLPFGAHAALTQGQGVYLRNSDGVSVRLSRLADVPDYIPEPRPDEPRHVRTSNLYGLVGSNASLALVDASRNVIWSIPIAPDTSPSIFASFPPVSNIAPIGPPVTDAVPATIRVVGDDFLVSFLTGFPFGRGAASVSRVVRSSGAIERVATGLQTAVDVLPIDGTGALSYVLEYSADFLAGGPGRLLRVDGQRGTTLVLAEGLVTPTNMALDPRSGDVFVTEFSRGRILRVLLPH